MNSNVAIVLVSPNRRHLRRWSVVVVGSVVVVVVWVVFVGWSVVVVVAVDVEGEFVVVILLVDWLLLLLEVQLYVVGYCRS